MSVNGENKLNDLVDYIHSDSPDFCYATDCYYWNAYIIDRIIFVVILWNFIISLRL